jgi:hypothetical protein
MMKETFIEEMGIDDKDKEEKLIIFQLLKLLSLLTKSI